MQSLSQDTLRIILLATLAAMVALLAMLALDRRDRAQAEAALAAPVSPTAAARIDAPLPDSAGAADTAPEAQAPAAGADEQPVPAEEPATGTEDVPAPAPQPACAKSNLIVDVPRSLPVFGRPGGGRRVGTMPQQSKYLGASMSAWVEQVSPNGKWGRVTVPWAWPQQRGWIRIDSLEQRRSNITVKASLGKRELRVLRGCDLLMKVPTAIGASASPSPKGRFFVTDIVAVPPSQPYFGSLAFGISTIQPNTPPGWSGGNQMAIHGTNSPGSIGDAVSAGCLRVSESTLKRLRRLVEPGTPVLIQA